MVSRLHSGQNFGVSKGMPSQLFSPFHIPGMRQCRRHFGAVMFCLLALIFQIALPITHIILEHPVLLSSPDERFLAEDFSDAGPILFAGMDTNSRHHDPDSCPICQALSLSRSFCVSTIATGLTSWASGEMVLPNYDCVIITTIFYSFSPRSPPIFA